MEEIFGPSDSVHWYHFIAGNPCVLRLHARNEHIYNGSRTSSLHLIIYTFKSWAAAGTKLVSPTENTLRASSNSKCQCFHCWIPSSSSKVAALELLARHPPCYPRISLLNHLSWSSSPSPYFLNHHRPSRPCPLSAPYLAPPSTHHELAHSLRLPSHPIPRHTRQQ